MLPLKTKIIWNKLESQRLAIIKSVSDLEHELITYRIASEKWNISEIFQHLVMSEKLSMIYLRKKRKYSAEIPNKTILTDLRSMILQFFMWNPIPLKAPARVNRFDPGRSLKDIIDEWGQIRTDMNNFLEELDSRFFNSELYKHPAVGKLTLDHMLRFFYVHVKRHEKQLHRIIKHYPKAKRNRLQ
jgi:hypothetical protein